MGKKPSKSAINQIICYALILAAVLGIVTIILVWKAHMHGKASGADLHRRSCLLLQAHGMAGTMQNSPV